MINRRLTSAEAATRLGIKPATLYSYVSRGLLHPERTPSGSTFDMHEVARLARSARHPGRPGRPEPAAGIDRRRAEPGGGDPVFVTELTLIDGGRLYYRGRDAVELSRTRRFEEVAEWLWTGFWPEAADGRLAPAWEMGPGTLAAVGRALGLLPAGAAPLERFTATVVAAALA